MTKVDKLTITVAKATNDLQEYLQVISGDNFTVNVVLIADEIEILDARESVKQKKKTQHDNYTKGQKRGLERAATICEQIRPAGGRAWTVEQRAVFGALTYAVEQLRAEMEKL